jgi:hypothetical protein
MTRGDASLQTIRSTSVTSTLAGLPHPLAAELLPAYPLHEWYHNETGDKLHIRLQGRFMYDAPGDPKMERDVAWGHCHPA